MTALTQEEAEKLALTILRGSMKAAPWNGSENDDEFRQHATITPDETIAAMKSFVFHSASEDIDDIAMMMIEAAVGRQPGTQHEADDFWTESRLTVDQALAMVKGFAAELEVDRAPAATLPKRIEGVPAAFYGGIGMAMFEADFARLPINHKINHVGNMAITRLTLEELKPGERPSFERSVECLEAVADGRSPVISRADASLVLYSYRQLSRMVMARTTAVDWSKPLIAVQTGTESEIDGSRHEVRAHTVAANLYMIWGIPGHINGVVASRDGSTKTRWKIVNAHPIASSSEVWEAKKVDGVWCVGLAGNLDTRHDATVQVTGGFLSDEEAESIARHIASEHNTRFPLGDADGSYPQESE